MPNILPSLRPFLTCVPSLLAALHQEETDAAASFSALISDTDLLRYEL